MVIKPGQQNRQAAPAVSEDCKRLRPRGDSNSRTKLHGDNVDSSAVKIVARPVSETHRHGRLKLSSCETVVRL